MHLDEHLNVTKPFKLAGRVFPIRELSLDAKARLQGWIKQHVPHPLRVVRDQLDGFSDRDRSILLDQARREAQHWPPIVDSPAGADALFKSPDGHRAVIREGLATGSDKVTDFDVEWVYRQIRTDGAKSREFIGTIFGLSEDDLEELDDDGPKAA
jgi:hypothetical protein